MKLTNFLLLAAPAAAKFSPYINRQVGEHSACGRFKMKDAPGIDHSNYMVQYYAKGKNDANVFAILKPRSCQEVLDEEAAKEQKKANKAQKQADREAKQAAKNRSRRAADSKKIKGPLTDINVGGEMIPMVKKFRGKYRCNPESGTWQGKIPKYPCSMEPEAAGRIRMENQIYDSNQ